MLTKYSFYYMYGMNKVCKLKLLCTETIIMGNLVNFSITRSSIIFVLEKRVTVSYSSTSP